MINAVKLFGAKVMKEGNCLRIEGCRGELQTPTDVIDCRNSGIVLRFIGALAALTPQYTVLTGDNSIRQQRVIKPLLDGLEQLGAFAKTTRGGEYAPLIIRGPLLSSKAHIDGKDSQPVSALLIAGALSPHGIELTVENPGETPWIDMTLHWLQKFQIPYIAKNYTHYHVKGNGRIPSFHYKVPGDYSSAAFPLAAALIQNQPLTLHNLDPEEIQGDKKIIPWLQKMGARIEWGSDSLTLHPGSHLKGIQIDVNECIDALPILAVVGCFAEGKTELMNGAIARKKESDRISAITEELKKMGARIQERPDGLVIEQSILSGASLYSHKDHRIAMSLAVAALAANGKSTVDGVEWIDKTYPTFTQDFIDKGAHFDLHRL